MLMIVGGRLVELAMRSAAGRAHHQHHHMCVHPCDSPSFLIPPRRSGIAFAQAASPARAVRRAGNRRGRLSASSGRNIYIIPRMTRPALVVLVLFRLASSQDVKVLWHLPQDVCGWERLPLDERYCERDGKQVYGRDNCKNYNLDYMPYPSRNKAEKACFDHGCQGLAKKGWLTRAYYPADPRRKSPDGRWVPWGFGWTATSSTTGYFYHDKNKDGIWVLEERPGTRTNGAYCYGCPPIHDCERRPVTCRSVGDPHFRGFDGQTWDFNGVGAYLLASVTKSFELQAYQCPGSFRDGRALGASANTALYMRAAGGSTLFLDGRDGSATVTDASRSTRGIGIVQLRCACTTRKLPLPRVTVRVAT